jgi:hypothetical protein
MAKNILVAFFTVFAVSCSSPRKLYISNKLHNTVTLKVNNDAVESAPGQAAFADSLNGRQIQPGHLILDFGKGKWTKQDRESLEALLDNIQVVKDGQEGSFTLPNTRVGHIGMFVNELIVRIKEPKNNKNER